MELLNRPLLERLRGEGAAPFRAGTPFPHVVIDDFLRPEAAATVLEEFDSTAAGWLHYHHVNERKRAFKKLPAMGPTTQALIAELQSPSFVAWLEEVTGIAALVADPEMDGGGLHEVRRGGFLNVHCDFLAHPSRKTWSRQINLLLYFNRDWAAEWGGDLGFWDRDLRCVKRMAPLLNRCVLFHTAPGSYHGHPEPLACPEGVSRKSLALYYFRDEGGTVRLSPTAYRSLPTDSIVRRGLIYGDRLLLNAYTALKRYTGLTDERITRLLKRFG